MAEGNPTLDPLKFSLKSIGYGSNFWGTFPHPQNWSFSVWNHEILGDHQNLRHPETGAASNDSITCQWCLIATGLQRNLLKTCILSMHAEMITKIIWDSISWDFLVQFLRVSRFLSAPDLHAIGAATECPSHPRTIAPPASRANAAHVNPSGRWDLIQSD